MSCDDVVTIDGVEYVRADLREYSEKDKMPYVIIRTYSAGVHAGWLKRRDGKEVELIAARRIWYWTGAATLSQLAIDGTVNPKGCKFPPEVGSIILTEAIEIIPCTEKARLSIRGVTAWRK